MASVFHRFRNVIGPIMAVAVLLSLFDPAIAWFVAPAALGGLVLAAGLFVIHRNHYFEHMEEATDSTGLLKPGTMFNLSSVSPTGIGGLGLSLMAVIAALNYREGQFLLLVGLTGGLVIAAAMIRYRQTHDTTQHRLPLHLRNGQSARR